MRFGCVLCKLRITGAQEYWFTARAAESNIWAASNLMQILPSHIANETKFAYYVLHIFAQTTFWNPRYGGNVCSWIWVWLPNLVPRKTKPKSVFSCIPHDIGCGFN